MEVGAWLRNLGLGRYEAAFRENEIDAEVLPDLADADLEKLGVVMGHRKRLLKAIADLSSSDRNRASSDQRAVKIEPEFSRPRGTPPADRDVLRSRWFDRNVGAARS